MYKPARVGNIDGNMLIDSFNGVSRTIFTLIEVITIIMLLLEDGYIKKISNADLNTFLMLMSGFLIFLLCCNMMLKSEYENCIKIFIKILENKSKRR